MRRLLLLLAGCACAAAILAAPASAGDANREPPRIELTAAGQEGILGPRSEALAYFSTSESEVPGEDTGAEYTKGSKVTFACTLDGRPIRCPSEYLPTEEGSGVLLRSARGQQRESLPGPFYGWVPMPKHLASGPHTVTVVASDEDGTDPNPPSVTVTMDRTPPSAPELTQRPPRRSWDHKPIFRFAADDEVRLVRRRGDTFTGSLRRLSPPGLVWKSYTFGDSFLSVWIPSCPTLLTCSGRAQASYMVSEHWYSYGEPERLNPGLYEFRIRSRDSVLNKSPLTSYRFRILRGRPR
ncbi:MAG TPA: hypothetical protein VFY75_09025 [Solirubrobacterales bacterium]|nr:hypothetical protein [Solirubrobacterales bacterium]